MNIQLDAKKSDVRGKFEVNIIIDGFSLQTVAFHNSDIERLISTGVLKYTRSDKKPDSAGISLTSKVYKTS